MTRRILGFLSLSAALAALVILLSVPASGQGSGVITPPLVITAYNGATPAPYTVPRTPWGDPDLQGVWSSDDTSGIPMQRPADLGTNLYQSDEQWAARQKQTEQG